MDTCSSNFVLSITILILSISHFTSARELLQFLPPLGSNVPGGFAAPSDTPVNNVNFTSQSQGSAYGQVVSVNGKPQSKHGEVSGITGTSHAGSETAQVPGSVSANRTNGNSQGTIYGSDGKPLIEAGKSNNGNVNVTIYGSNGQPVFHYDSPPAADQVSAAAAAGPAVSP
ncbi:hypothetical protein LINGRAHAP2_LOCUS11384 [Linum grandiflorum]